MPNATAYPVQKDRVKQLVGVYVVKDRLCSGTAGAEMRDSSEEEGKVMSTCLYIR